MENKVDIVKATEVFNKEQEAINIFVFGRKPIIDASKKGILLNDGYTYDVNGSIPEIADAIAKFAIELPNNGFGEQSDTMFIQLIRNYYDKIKQGE